MNRITPEQVVEAYKKTGLHPVDGVWVHRRLLEKDEVMLCGCALSAVCCSKGESVAAEFEIISYYSGQGYGGVAHHLGYELKLDPGYIQGFMNGFDDEEEMEDTPEYNQGYKDGLAARAEVFDEFGEPKLNVGGNV